MASAGVLLLGSLTYSSSAAYAETRHEVGFSTSATLLHMNDADLDARLTDIEHMGGRWIRVDMSWAAIQPNNRYIYHWGMYDRLVRVAGVHHLKILAVLDYTPAWAQEPECARRVITKAAGTKCGPADNNTFGRFARAAALRYKGKSVRAWEIWNEPNNSSYWKVAQGRSAVLTNSRAYAALANTAALQIRRNDPGTRIITGGLGPMFDPVYPKGIRQGDFLAQMLPLLKPELFDGVGIHPYSWPALPNTAAIYNAFYTVDQGPSSYNLRAIMSKAGWGNKQIWGTEFGAPTKGISRVTVPTLAARPDHVSEAVQAQIVAQGMREWYAMPNAGPLFFHADSDQWLPQTKNEGSFGLRRRDGSPKPAYNAFEQAAKQLP